VSFYSSNLLDLLAMNTQITPDERRQLAEKVGINEQYLYQCLTGRREMSAWEAVRVEQQTEGRVNRKMVCQGSWQSIWPELVESA
jgi:DNA-binding transcriptional regulator YdaS (Cro superfamily)